MKKYIFFAMSWPPKIKGLFTRESIKMDKKTIINQVILSTTLIINGLL